MCTRPRTGPHPRAPKSFPTAATSHWSRSIADGFSGDSDLFGLNLMLQLGAGHGWMVQTDDGNVGRAVMVAFHDASHRKGNFLDTDRWLDETALEGVTMLRQDYPELRSRQTEKR